MRSCSRAIMAFRGMAALNSFKEAGMRKLTGWFVVMLVAVVAVSFAFVNVVGVTYALAQGDKKDDMKNDKMDKKAEKKDKKAEKEKKADKMDKKAAKMEKKAEKKEEKKEAEKK